MTDDRLDSAASGNGPLRWEDKVRFQKLFSRQAMRAYLYLSLGMGLIAALLPIALLLSGDYHGHHSISHFYYDQGKAARNILVGCLWAVGVFLILFQGLSRRENWLLNIAGAAAIGVAMFPTAPTQECGKFSLSIHHVFATTFFLCLAVVAIGFSKTRIQYIVYPPKRVRFKRAYNLAGAAMIAMPAAVVFLTRRECGSHWVFWVESFGIWAFAGYWFVKTAEYKMLLRIKWSPSARERTQVIRALEEQPKWRARQDSNLRPQA